eukprot:CAMPEP_0175077584 /NCGR_PEP_ID=MMETSP0052_2-20121109/23490_1 /TAXON_ID=51329 ORGANISM="Polytomella parva, Strain SAG 63-3" /NCGR_SAMPLE_ID=MMETSP0052_2 /ASSEMBLY_ACC=CAM_ASM_000194 /LENGTH=306 /DNA_ID=CAMNT_0016347103 /DNA_START=50 /DNA_END=967 /DNA_ORIENTATION=-
MFGVLKTLANLEVHKSVYASLAFQTTNVIRYHSTYDHLSQHIQRVVTPHAVDSLYTKGYAVIDGIFPAHFADAARAEVVALYDNDRMHKNCTHFVAPASSSASSTSIVTPTPTPKPSTPSLIRSVPSTSTLLLEKTHIHEAELSLDASIRRLAPLCASVATDHTLLSVINKLLPSSANTHLDSQAIKLQYNAGGGGCFPIHFDTNERLDGRRVTAIFYLNPDWKVEHGGALRLYPFPAPPIDVAPKHNRAVLFASARLAHRVMPSTMPRCCFTVWISDNGSRKTEAAISPPSHSSSSSSSDSQLPP